MTSDHDDASEGLDIDPEIVKSELLAAWLAAHADGTPQEFEAEWAAVTGASQPTATVGAPASEDQDPRVIKHRLFEEWVAQRPGGTREEFQAEWDAIT